MSLILDALNKADHERRKQTDEMPGLDSHHDDPTPTEDGSRLPKLAMITAASAVVLVGLAAGAYFWGKGSGQPTATATPVVMAAVEKPAPAPAPAQAAPAAVKTAAPAAKAEKTAAPHVAPAKAKEEDAEARPEVAALYNQPEPTPAPPPDQAAELAAREAAAAQAEAAKKEAAARQAAAAKAAAAQQAAAAQSTPFKSTGQPVTTTQAHAPAQPNRPPYPMMEDFTQIGTIRSLPWSIQEKIPSMTYSEHHYQPGEQGTVVLNGVTRKKGDQIAQDLRLEAVLYDGILLRYQNDVFKLQALSSWVNM